MSMKFTPYSNWRLVKVYGDLDTREFFDRPLRLQYYEFDKKKCEDLGVEYKEGKFWGVNTDDVYEATEVNEKGARKVNLEKLIPFLLKRISVLENKLMKM